MKRRAFDGILATTGLIVTTVLLLAGVLLSWGGSFANDSIKSQLVAQKIFFPTTDAITAANDPEITKYVTPYAGQQVVNGKQAQVFADHYIGVHLKAIAGGKTYSEVSGQYIGLSKTNPNDPGLAALATQRQSLFMGETLRGLLLNAYAFGKVASIAVIGAVVAFALAGVMLLLSLLGFWHLRRVPVDQEVASHKRAHKLAHA